MYVHIKVYVNIYTLKVKICNCQNIGNLFSEQMDLYKFARFGDYSSAVISLKERIRTKCFLKVHT